MRNMYKYLFLLLFLFAVTSQAQAATKADLQELWRLQRQQLLALDKKMEESVLFIMGYDKQQNIVAAGTGFVVAPGYMLTHASTFKKATLLRLFGKLDKYMNQFSLVKKEISEANDYMLLKFEKNYKIQPLTFNLSSNLTDPVSSWGFPDRLMERDIRVHDIAGNTYTGFPPVMYVPGTITTYVDNGKRKSIIHSAVIANGSFGGPLVNRKGEVVGMNAWVTTDPEDRNMVNAAFPAKDIVAFLRANGVEPKVR